MHIKKNCEASLHQRSKGLQFAAIPFFFPAVGFLISDVKGVSRVEHASKSENFPDRMSRTERALVDHKTSFMIDKRVCCARVSVKRRCRFSQYRASL